MSAISIAIGRLAPGGEDALGRYAAATIPLIHAAGGKSSTAGGQRIRLSVKTTTGLTWRPMRFESSDAIRAFLGGDAYQQQVLNRNHAFAAVHSYIAEDI